MLVHVHGMRAPAGITTGGIVPDSSCTRCKPDLECVQENAVGVVRIHRDSLVVPVLGIVALGIVTVSKRAALGAFHITPSPAAVCGSPGAELAAVGVTTTGVVIKLNRTRLSVNVIRVTRRDSDVDASELVGGANTGSGPTAYGIVARRAGACVHRRTCRVRAASDLCAKYESISIAGN